MGDVSECKEDVCNEGVGLEENEQKKAFMEMPRLESLSQL